MNPRMNSDKTANTGAVTRIARLFTVVILVALCFAMPKPTRAGRLAGFKRSLVASCRAQGGDQEGDQSPVRPRAELSDRCPAPRPELPHQLPDSLVHREI